VEAADDQLREIKKLRPKKPKSFKRKGNEIQYKFNLKLQDTLDDVKPHLESNAVDKAKSSLSEGTSMLSEAKAYFTSRQVGVWLENCRAIYPARVS